MTATNPPGQSDPAATSFVSSSDRLTVAAARMLEGRSVVFAGHGLPTIAVALAQQTCAPDLELVYESGVTGARPRGLPLSISDSLLVPGAAGVMPMTALFNYVLQGERIDVGFLGAAQIDKYGSLNSTLIGESWESPRARLPGSGAAIEVMAGAKEVFVVMRHHTTKTFVETLDFCTSPSPHAAAQSHTGAIGRGLGVTTVISELGVLTRSHRDEQLTLTALQPGVTVEDVQAATGWDLQVSDLVSEIAGPTDDELQCLRLLDPARVYLR